MVAVDFTSSGGTPARFPDRQVNLSPPMPFHFQWKDGDLLDTWRTGYELFWRALRIVNPVLEAYANLDLSNQYFIHWPQNALAKEAPDRRVRLLLPVLQAPGSTLMPYLELRPDKLCAISNAADNKTQALVNATLLVLLGRVYERQLLSSPVMATSEDPYWLLAHTIVYEALPDDELQRLHETLVDEQTGPFEDPADLAAQMPTQPHTQGPVADVPAARFETYFLSGLDTSTRDVLIQAQGQLIEELLGKDSAEAVEYAQVDTLGQVVHPLFGQLRLCLQHYPFLQLLGPPGSGKSTLARQLLDSFTQPVLILPCSAFSHEGSLMRQLFANDGPLATQLISLYKDGGSLLLEYAGHGYDSYHESFVRLFSEPSLLIPGLGTKALLTRHAEFRLIVTGGNNYSNKAGVFSGYTPYVQHSLVLCEQLLPDRTFCLALGALRASLDKTQRDQYVLQHMGVGRYAAAARLLLSGLSPEQAWDQLFHAEYGQWEHYDRQKLDTAKALLKKTSALSRKGQQKAKRQQATQARTELALAQASPQHQQEFARALLEHTRSAAAPPVLGPIARVPATYQQNANGEYVDTESGEVYPDLSHLTTAARAA